MALSATRRPFSASPQTNPLNSSILVLGENRGGSVVRVCRISIVFEVFNFKRSLTARSLADNRFLLMGLFASQG